MFVQHKRSRSIITHML